MKTGLRFLGASLIAVFLTHGLGYVFYLLIGHWILAAGAHVPDTALPYDFIFATSAFGFVTGVIAGYLAARIVGQRPMTTAAAAGGIITLLAITRMRSPHMNEWAMQFVPLLGMLLGGALARPKLPNSK
jgi:hypothetical protein